MGKLKLYDGTQFIIIDAFPRKSTKSFTTASVTSGGGTLEIDEAFNNRALMRKLVVTPTDGGATSFTIEFFKAGTFNADKLEYKATSTTGTFTDDDVWFHEDEDASSELHLRLTNDSGTTTTFTVDLVQEVFA